MGVVGGRIRRFDVYLVTLDPTVGSEMQKTRPCLVISPDTINYHLTTVIVAPMATRSRHYPTRVACSFQGREGEVVLDQVRAVDKKRLIKYLGRVDEGVQQGVLSVLFELFAP